MINLQDQTLLIIAPHPDDEILGCGGLIKRIKDEDGKVYVIFMTVGKTKEYTQNGESSGEERIKEIENVAEFLKYDGWRIAFPGDDFHLRIDSIPQKDIIREIENGDKISLNTVKPTIVAVTKPTDYNQDHHASAHAVFAAARPAPSTSKPLQRIILEYESVVTSEWWEKSPYNPNFFIELSDKDITAKIEALKLYKSQIRENSHQRSPEGIKNISYFRGLQCGTTAAEAYYCNRFVT